MRHGHDGWELADYEWNEKTGYGKLEYVRVRAADGAREESTLIVAQPSLPSHDGWNVKPKTN